MQEALFCQALGLNAPWAVERVALDVQRSRIDLYVVWQAKSAPCPACSAVDQKLHDQRQRSWRHLDFFQFEAHVHCQLPRVASSVCGATTQLNVPWAREGSRFTLLFEALSLTLAREMPVAACARILRCADNALWRQIDAHVNLARAQENYADVKIIGIDETNCAKGHSYITLVHDLGKPRLIYATPGKDASTVQRFTQDFKVHQGQPQAIEVVCMDMSKAFMAGAAQHLPAAATLCNCRRPAAGRSGSGGACHCRSGRPAHGLERLAQQRPVVGVVVAQEGLVQAAALLARTMSTFRCRGVMPLRSGLRPLWYIAVAVAMGWGRRSAPGRRESRSS
jgi:hypothetical protein